MPDTSYISHVRGAATTFAGPDAVKLVRAAQLKGFIQLWLRSGIIPTRGVGIQRMLTAAFEFTGKHYTRREAADAINDLHIWCETMKAALPVEIR